MLLSKMNLGTFETFQNILRKETQYMYIHLYIYKSLMVSLHSDRINGGINMERKKVRVKYFYSGFYM